MVKKIILYTTLALIISACAQVVAPTGGERDIIPPTILKSSPENRTINFSAKEISFQFDEFVVLKDFNKQVIVSPPLKHKLKTKLKGKTLILSIEDTLLPNTTYVFNFGNAVVDLNEANPVDNFQYVFSTGEELDSLSLKGKIVDAFSLKVEEDFFAMLYPVYESDSIPAKELPKYIAKSDADGNFTISNIKEGKYNLFAIQDANSNYLYDRVTEKIGFLSETISLPENKKQALIYAFEPTDDKQFIEEQKVSSAKLELTFKNDVISPKLKVLTENDSLEILQQIVDKNKITVWFSNVIAEKVKIQVQDSTFIDTVKLNVKKLNPEDTLQLESTLGGVQNFWETKTLEFNRPIKFIQTDHFILQDTNETNLDLRVTIDSLNPKKINLNFEQKEGEVYVLNILPNAINDLYGGTTDSINSILKINSAIEFGNLEVKLKDSSLTPRIIQLTDKTGKVVSEKLNTNKISTFYHVKPGEYRLKLIFDTNSNGKWDSGDFYSNLQPERTLLYDESIVIRENWDKEITWIFKEF